MPEPGSVSTGRHLPSGTVTFAFTDIEGSTQRWDRNRAAMQEAVRLHDALMRAAIADYGGCVFKTIGDAFCAAFWRPGDAIAAMIAAQRALAAADFSLIDGLHVRMAVHAGTADERDDDYFGPTVNRVARLLAIAHGGQVLVSGTTADLLGFALPDQATLRDLGEHRLKDLVQREKVYQLLAPDLRGEFPALRSVDSQPNNLPAALTSFVGRETEVDEIVALLHTHRLVTLVGTGGIGKTRTALAAAGALLAITPEGAWLVELAPLGRGSFVANAVAQALCVQDSPSRPLIETLVAYLKEKALLLVLDNCEHVVTEAANLASALLRDCPNLRILATSRERLQIGGERTYRLPSLGVPASGTALGLSASGGYAYPAVSLFVDRAQTRDSSFTLDAQNAPAVAAICRRLDGIPLAIELAAARVNVMPAQALLHKLDQRFRVLTSGDRTVLPRHQTMRALFDWSYDLLSPPQQLLFEQLSIFAGGSTVAAICTVAGNDVDELDVLELLSSLVDKSLITADRSACEPRYGMLESARDYAREKLVFHGAAAHVAHIHAAAFLQLAEHLEREYDVAPTALWFTRVEAEIENWRAALEWTLARRSDVLLGQRLAGTLSCVWMYFSVSEGQHWLLAAQELVDEATPVLVAANIERSLAAIAEKRGEWKAALAGSLHASALYREIRNEVGQVRAAMLVGWLSAYLGRAGEAEALLRETVDAARALGRPRLVGAVLDALASASSAAGKIAESRAQIGEALAIFTSIGADGHAASAACTLAEAEFSAGNTERALELSATWLPVMRTPRQRVFLANALNNRSGYLIAAGRLNDARAVAGEALEVAQDVGKAIFVVFSLGHIAAVAALFKSGLEDASVGYRDAAQLLGYVDTRLTALGAARGYTEEFGYDAALARLHAALEPAALAELIAAGAIMTNEKAIGIARSLMHPVQRNSPNVPRYEFEVTDSVARHSSTNDRP